MDLALSEAQQLFRDSLKDYLEREVPFSRVREVERSGGFDAQLWTGLAQLGYLGLPLPGSAGGSDGTIIDLALLVDILARRAVLIPIIEVMTAALALSRFGSASDVEDLLSRVIGGSAIIIPAVYAAAGTVAAERAHVQDGRLNGEKLFVSYAQAATHFLVEAEQNDECGLYLVEASDRSVSARPLRTIGRIPQAIVRFDAASAVKVTEADGVAFLAQLARVLTAAACLGSAEQALDMTVDYVGMRVQFGRPIGSFQAVQHHVANMATAVTATRFLVYEAAWSLENGLVSNKQIALAKAAASKTATEVPMLAHQLHGGIGYIEEYDLYFFSLRGKQHALTWGSADECLREVAGLIEEDDRWLQIGSASTRLESSIATL